MKTLEQGDPDYPVIWAFIRTTGGYKYSSFTIKQEYGCYGNKFLGIWAEDVRIGSVTKIRDDFAALIPAVEDMIVKLRADAIQWQKDEVIREENEKLEIKRRNHSLVQRVLGRLE